MATIANVAAPGPASPRRPLGHLLEERRREAVAAAIEDAALDLFADRPAADVTVHDIAERAGVGVRTIYRYFTGKEDVLLAFPDRGAAQFAELLRARPPDESPFEALRNTAIASYAAVDPRENDRWLAAVAHSTNPEKVSLAARGRMASAAGAALAERIGAAPDDVWPTVAGAIVAAAMQVGAIRWMAKGGDFLEHQLAAFDVARYGLEGPPRAGDAPRATAGS